MSEGLRFVALLVAALGCGVIGGVFFAFSAFVMKALVRLPPAQGIAAMQSINVVAVTPVFMAVLFGTAQVCLMLGVWSLVGWDEARTGYVLFGSLLYLVGTVLVTIVGNVPRNNELAAVAPEGSDAASVWARFVAAWTSWNAVRMTAALAAAALLTVALATG